MNSLICVEKEKLESSVGKELMDWTSKAFGLTLNWYNILYLWYYWIILDSAAERWLLFLKVKNLKTNFKESRPLLYVGIFHY